MKFYTVVGVSFFCLAVSGCAKPEPNQADNPGSESTADDSPRADDDASWSSETWCPGGCYHDGVYWDMGWDHETAPCCETDDDCPYSKLVCVLPPGITRGRCGMPANPSYTCYVDEDCLPSYTCIGAITCNCGDECGENSCSGENANCIPTACELGEDTCVPTAGHCQPMSSGCCTHDADCPTGTRCVNLHGEAQGTCLATTNGAYHTAPWPEANNFGSCWDDSDCTLDSRSLECIGALQCPCDADCEAPANRFGVCQLEGFRDCVAQNEGCDCGPGQCQPQLRVRVYYPSSEGPFAPAEAASPELLGVAKAIYTCNPCTCEETWNTSPGEEPLMTAVGSPEEMCQFTEAWDWERNCRPVEGCTNCGPNDGCLAVWSNTAK